MRFKKVMSGLLAGALVATSVFGGNVTTAKAETTPEAAKYSFDFNAENLDSTGSSQATLSVVGAGNAASTSAPVYEAGRSGGAEDKSVKLDSYALSMPANIGDDYTVNVWLKPNVTTIANNNAIFLLGSASPEEWVAFAGSGQEGKARVWGNYGGYHELTGDITMVKDQWTMLTFAQAGSVLEIYQDGVLKKTDESAAKILNGDAKRILLGTTYWTPDNTFNGWLDDVQIFDKKLTMEQIQSLDPNLNTMFEDNLKKGVTAASILGKNESEGAVKYDLALPADFSGLKLSWKSDKADVISDDGKVRCAQTEQKVTMTGTAASGALTAEVKFELTVQPLSSLDSAELQAQLATAKAAQSSADFKYYTAQSQQNLTKLISRAENAANQGEMDEVAKVLKAAIAKLAYAEEYLDPFAKIDGSKFANLTVTPKGSSTALAEAIPTAIRQYVTVEYISGNPGVAAVDKNTGNVTGVKVGNALITAKVKAVYDGFEMEYQALVTVNLDMSGVAASAGKTSLAKGEKTSITVNCPAAVQAAGPSITYRATGAVSVKNGQVTADKAGKGTVAVKVKAGGKTITKKVVFNVGEITGESKVKVKKSITLQVTGISGKVSWSLDKKGKKLATISKKGKLTAKKKTGKVTVTAKVGNVTMKKTIKITKK